MSARGQATLGLALAAACLAPGRAPAAPAPPRRIISLSPAVTETLFALGVGERVVGVTRYCDQPPAALRLPKIGGYLDPNAEAVMRLRPDLVVAAPSPGNRRPVVALQRLGLEVLVVSDRTLDDLLASLGVLGARLGRVEQATAMAAELAAGLARIRERGLRRRPMRAMLVYGHHPLVVAGPGSYGGELLALLGLDNVAQGARPYPIFSMERVLVSQPEVIFDAAMDAGVDPLGYWAAWPEVPAVRHRRVLVVSDAVLRPGPRIVDALEELAGRLRVVAPAVTPASTVGPRPTLPRTRPVPAPLPPAAAP